MRILVTGSQGFIGSYICQELLSKGYEVIGIDNYSKYGHVVRPQDDHPNFKLAIIDLSKDVPIIDGVKPDYIIACAAMIGGIAYFHKYAYKLLATNERILANTFDAAIQCRSVKKIIVLSSSMVFENTTTFPTTEASLNHTPPPTSTYGLQKLASEYFAKGAWQEHNLPYTIVRPFNCVGVGEDASYQDVKMMSGNIQMMMSHVLPDFVNKALHKQQPFHIFGNGNQKRCFTNGRDIAKGIRLAMESNEAHNNDFNISTSRVTTIRELAETVWSMVNPNDPVFELIYDTPFEHDVQERIPDVSKAKTILGFEAKITLEESIQEVIDYMK